MSTTIALGCFPLSQTNESFNLSRESKDETESLNKRQEIPTNNLNSTLDIDACTSDNNSHPLEKSTGNTPRFGQGKKIDPSRLMKPRPTKLIAKFNDCAVSENSPLVVVAGQDIGKIFDYNQSTKKDSPALSLLSPSNQARIETGSGGNSPKRKQYCSLKHPLISKKSPLFKKFGIDPAMMNHTNNSESHGNYLSEKKGAIKMNDSHLTSEMNYSNERIKPKQIFEKRNEGEKFSKEANSFLNNSPTDKPNKMFTFYSGKKIYYDKGSLPPKIGSICPDTGSINSYVNSEPSVDWTCSTLSSIKTKLMNIKENIQIRKIAPNTRLHQFYSLFEAGITNTKDKQPSLQSYLLSGNHFNENFLMESNQNEIVPGKNLDPSIPEYRRRNFNYINRMIISKKPKGCNFKDNSVNESFNSMDFSAAHDNPEKNTLMFNKEDGFSQNILKEREIGEHKNILKNPLQIQRQLTYDLDRCNQDPESSKGLRKSTSANHLDITKQHVGGQSQIPQKVAFKFSDSNKLHARIIIKSKRAASQNTYLNGGKRLLANSFLADDPGSRIQTNLDIRGHSVGCHDRNTSMYEISQQDHEHDSLFHAEENSQKLEEAGKKRAESALSKQSSISNNENIFEQNRLSKRNSKDEPRSKVQILSSEKNNLKHFQFGGSPSMKESILENQTRQKNDLTKPYIKPQTCGSKTRTYERKGSLNVKNRVRRELGFNSAEPIRSNHNDSEYEDSSANIIEKSRTKISVLKADRNYLSQGKQEARTSNHLNPVDFSAQKLRDAIKKLQAKDQESQLKIAKLHMQLEDQNKVWEKKFEVYEQKWKYKLTQQKENYKKTFNGANSKRVQPVEVGQL